MSGKNETDSKSAVREIVISRIFNASVKMVWKAWSEPEHLKKWWGPKDYTSPFSKIDFRVGGKYLHAMRNAEGQEFWSTGTYTEIVPMKKIACTDSFSDKDGNALSAADVGMPGDNWPKELFVTITFEDLGGKTKMTLRHVGIPEGVMTEMTNAGWNESLDKLQVSLSAVN